MFKDLPARTQAAFCGSGFYTGGGDVGQGHATGWSAAHMLVDLSGMMSQKKKKHAHQWAGRNV